MWYEEKKKGKILSTRHPLQGNQGINDLDNVLGLVQVHGGKHIELLHSQLLRSLDELVDVLHLVEGHLGGSRLADTGLQGVDQLAQHRAVVQLLLQRRGVLASLGLDPLHHLVLEGGVSLAGKLLSHLSTEAVRLSVVSSCVRHFPCVLERNSSPM